MPGPEPTVFVVDDDAAVRDSLRWLVSSVQLPVKTFETADAFLAELTPRAFGCVLIDVRMPGMSGLQLQEVLKERAADLAVIIITAHADVPMAIRAMKAGAVEFIEKPFNDQHVIELISAAIAKNAAALRTLEQSHEIQRRLESLTARENQVFQRIVAGHPNKVIAHDLKLSQKTIEIHRAKVMRKMRAKSFADLVTMSTKLEQHRETS
ncbi:MAG TPA: response regulator [Rhodospirillales bacterium]